MRCEPSSAHAAQSGVEARAGGVGGEQELDAGGRLEALFEGVCVSKVALARGKITCVSPAA
jgi:hypothetical protein